jgi:protein-serine/threonine kinase
VYRDFKPENILLDSEGHAVVIDFGLSYNVLNFDQADVNRIAGTIQYFPPEAFEETMPYGFGVDWWAVGIFLHEVLAHKLPYSNFIEQNAHEPEKIKAILQQATLAIDQNLDPDARDLIEKLLVTDVSLRLGSTNDAADLKAHPFFAEIDWDLMIAKQFNPPIIGRFTDKYDTKSFDSEFTNEEINFVDKSSQNYNSKTFQSESRYF